MGVKSKIIIFISVIVSILSGLSGVLAYSQPTYKPNQIPKIFDMSYTPLSGESTHPEPKSIQKNSNLPIQDQIRQLEPELADTLIALADCESDFRPDVRGVVDNRDRGLYQINSRWHPEVSDDCAFDLVCATRWTAEMIRKGEGHQWVCFNKI